MSRTFDHPVVHFLCLGQTVQALSPINRLQMVVSVATELVGTSQAWAFPSYDSQVVT